MGCALIQQFLYANSLVLKILLHCGLIIQMLLGMFLATLCGLAGPKYGSHQVDHNSLDSCFTSAHLEFIVLLLRMRDFPCQEFGCSCIRSTLELQAYSTQPHFRSSRWLPTNSQCLWIYLTPDTKTKLE